MRRHAVKTPGGLNIGQGADVKHAGKGFRVPGDGGIDVIKQSFPHHKGFAGAAFFPGAAVKTHRSATAMLFKPAFYRHRTGQRRGAQEVMPAAVTIRSRRGGLRGCTMRLLA